MPLSPAAAGFDLVIVHVRDDVNHILAGHDGREYTSPPHAPADALALVGLLLGRPTHADRDDHLVWRCPVAGGQRTITLTPAPANSNGDARRDAQP